MACVDGGGPPPPDLELAFLCMPHHLPDAGAINDQDYATLIRMRGAYNIYSTLSRVRNMTGAQIHDLTNEERRLLALIRDMGLLYG